MVRVLRRVLATLVGILLLAGAPASGQGMGAVRPPEQPLSQALVDLQQRGLRIIFSSEVVKSHMVVRDRPSATSPRRILDELLAEHGLIARRGPGDTLLVVRNPRARPDRRTTEAMAGASSIAAVATAGDGAEPPRFKETVLVTDVATRDPGTGTPPLVVLPESVRVLAGGFENVFRTLHTLPGVTPTDELGSRIAVRGGSPDQNLTVMDGIEIYNPFRLVVPAEDLATAGLASTFNADTIERVEFSPGAFDVRYGDRLSSLLDVTHREGSEAERVQGSALLSLSDANVLAEGRLPGQSPGSWLVSARRTYLGSATERVTGAKLPAFQDVHARASWRPRPGRRVSIVGLSSRERSHSGDSAAADAGHSTRTENDLAAFTVESTMGVRGRSRTVASYTRFADVINAYERSFDNSRGANTVESISTGGLVAFQFFRADRGE